MSRWSSPEQWEADADLMERVLREAHRRMDAAGLSNPSWWLHQLNAPSLAVAS